MISHERSFNQLCSLIREGPDNYETAVEINELLNNLYRGYSELKIFRAVAERFGRSGAHPGKNKQIKRRDSADRRARGRDVELAHEGGNALREVAEREGDRNVLRFVVPASAGFALPDKPA